MLERSGAELQRLRGDMKKLQMQNWNLAQSNSLMLALFHFLEKFEVAGQTSSIQRRHRRDESEIEPINQIAEIVSTNRRSNHLSEATWQNHFNVDDIWRLVGLVSSVVVSNAAFVLVSLSVNKLFNFGFESVFGYPLFKLHSSPNSQQEVASGDQVSHSSSNSGLVVGSDDQHVIHIN
ncbi:hypothetical protein P8452_43728 [Trifolium repens]|nr:hypothetical protein P8452_43728 [Trifolium repens]